MTNNPTTLTYACVFAIDFLLLFVFRTFIATKVPTSVPYFVLQITLPELGIEKPSIIEG